MMPPFFGIMQFAHGSPEVRAMSRHPKYKTEECRSYHTTGVCPYGPRCHFVHEPLTEDGYPQPAEGAQVSQTQAQALLPEPVLVDNGLGVGAGPGAHMHSMHGMPPQMVDGSYIGKMQQLGSHFSQMQMHQMAPNVHMPMGGYSVGLVPPAE